MSTDYRLKVIRAEGLNWKHPLHSKVPNLFVEVKLGDVKKKTRTVVKNSLPTWNVSIPLCVSIHNQCNRSLIKMQGSSSDDSATLEIQVKHESTWIKDPCVGMTSITITDLLRKCVDGETSLYLMPTGKSSMASAGQIVLDLEVMDAMTSAGASLAAASEDVRQRKMMRSIRASEVTQSIRSQASQLDNQGDLYRAVGQLLSKLDAFRQFMDVLSEMHPFLTIVWKIASGLYSAVEKVYKTDNRVIHLVQSMDDAFAFVRDVETLRGKSASLQQAIVGLLKQKKTKGKKTRSFLGRMLDVSSGQKIGEFERALAGFKQQIESGVVLHTAIVSTRVPQEIDDLLLQQRLSPDRERSKERFKKVMALLLLSKVPISSKTIDGILGFRPHENCIPKHSSEPWFIDHLRDAPYFPDMLKNLTDFAHQRLLFWFEVLSLVKSFGRIASRALIDAAEWIKSDDSTDLTVFLRDASDLATISAFPIVECAPHIYVMIIPLSKDESMVSSHYSKQMSSMIQVQRMGSKRWKANHFCFSRPYHYNGEEIMALKGDSNSVGFFPDGRRLMSLSTSGTLRIWNDQTDDLVASRDDYGTIIVWHVSTGTEFVRSIGHTDRISSVAFPLDGKLLASEVSIIVWEANNGDVVAGPLVAGIWNTATWEVISELATGSTNSAVSIHFSPDSTQVALSAEEYCTVIVWVGNTEQGQVISGPYRLRMYPG
ncbi:hypothetical protein ACEPAF_1868 [Sanghuangporus sanghuang]